MARDSFKRKMVPAFQHQSFGLIRDSFDPVALSTTESAICEKSRFSFLGFRLVIFFFAMPEPYVRLAGKRIFIQTDPTTEKKSLAKDRERELHAVSYYQGCRVACGANGMKTKSRRKEVSRVRVLDQMPRRAKVKGRSIGRAEAASRDPPPETSSSPAAVGFPIVGVGASAGGLEALTELLQNLPTDTGMAFVLVQHLDPTHVSALTQLLSKATSLPVREVTHDVPVQSNHIYVIAPNTRMGIAQRTLNLLPREDSAGANRSIDFFFESLARDQRERAIGVILSGMASDGTLGLEAIKAEGGITFAQDESAKYDSMPRSAVAAGGVEFVLSPPNIARAFARVSHPPYARSGAALPPEDMEAAECEKIAPEYGRRER